MRRLLICVAVLTGLMGALLGSPAAATVAGRDGRIVFVRSNQIYTIAPAGGTALKLTSSGKNYKPKWSADGKRIAYVHEPSTNVRELWTMKADGTAKTRVTLGGNVTAGPSWSPDGKWLAYAVAEPGDTGPYCCRHTALLKIRSTAPFGAPATLLGYWNYETSEDGTHLPPHPIDLYRYLAWSPDGTRIVFTSKDPAMCDDALNMYYVATGFTEELGEDGCAAGDYIAHWSDFAWGPAGQYGYGWFTGNPDDAELHYQYETQIIYPGFVSQVHVVDDLTDTAPAIPIGDQQPAPSPSGRFLAFLNDASGTARVMVANANGSGRRVLTTGYQPDWQALH